MLGKNLIFHLKHLEKLTDFLQQKTHVPDLSSCSLIPRMTCNTENGSPGTQGCLCYFTQHKLQAALISPPNFWQETAFWRSRASRRWLASAEYLDRASLGAVLKVGCCAKVASVSEQWTLTMSVKTKWWFWLAVEVPWNFEIKKCYPGVYAGVIFLPKQNIAAPGW